MFSSPVLKAGSLSAAVYEDLLAPTFRASAGVHPAHSASARKTTGTATG